jgi:hypothetical protein
MRFMRAQLFRLGKALICSLPQMEDAIDGRHVRDGPVQAAVDQAGNHRRLLEQVKETAQELLNDHEAQPERSKTRRRQIVR